MPDKTVYKYKLQSLGDYYTLELPVGAQILKFATQYNIPALWALVDPEAALVKRRFRVAGTGHKISSAEVDRLTYIGTCQLREGTLVWHLFEVD
jgi:hypothetical protein